MKFDARSSNDAGERAAFIEWIVSEAASGFGRFTGGRESLRAPLFLYLHRAYEAHLEPDLIADLLGSSEGCILDRATLSKEDECTVLEEYNVLAPLIEAMYKDT
jgi:hypothetical protein